MGSPAAVRVRRNRAAIPTPSPENLSQRPRRSSKKLSSVDILSSCDESRPLSTDTARWSGGGDLTDASSWVGGVLRRGASSRAGQRPLTRYLPVTTQENFDLRSHIETGGHQIELCKHIILNSCSCRGYLNKMGARFKSWNKRWFVFDRNKRTLVYYADKSEWQEEEPQHVPQAQRAGAGHHPHGGQERDQEELPASQYW